MIKLTLILNLFQIFDSLKEVLEAQMYGRNSDSELLNKLDNTKNQILSNSLSQQEKNDFMAKYKVLHEIYNGGLRNGFIGTAHDNIIN